MKKLSTTKVREKIKEVLEFVSEGNVVALERYGLPQALIIKYPEEIQSDLPDSTLLSQYGGAFDWLKDEPDLYTESDVIEKYE